MKAVTVVFLAPSGFHSLNVDIIVETVDSCSAPSAVAMKQKFVDCGY
jgi:hypothetical protein